MTETTSKTHAWASAFTFSNGGTSISLTVAPDEAQAAAAAMHVLVRGSPALASPDVALTSALTIKVDDAWLIQAYRAVIKGQRQAAPVLQMVPQARREHVWPTWVAGQSGPEDRCDLCGETRYGAAADCPGKRLDDGGPVPSGVA